VVWSDIGESRNTFRPGLVGKGNVSTLAIKTTSSR
jgi:hypothetical protein